MTKSMTGYGRAVKTIDNFDISVEIKSVNHRYADFSLRVPRHYGFLEEHIRSYLKERISRGKVDISVTVRKSVDDSKEILPNIALAKSYIDAFSRISDEFGIQNDITVTSLTRFSEIFEITHKEDDEDELLSRVLTLTEEAVEGFTAMRVREGEKLAADMLMRNRIIAEELSKIEALAPKAVIEYREKIEARIKELLGDAPIDENRLLTETALYADRLSVTEEIVRLKSHIVEFDRIMAQNEPVGRKLDFLLQEMNREINTIGSKSNDLEITRIVVNIKSELEKIREQIQNIE
ncbi:MAG: hypothetical protein BWY15_01814 [Firmicutes bacterium ADurb.Bin193]|nr:MAG: hypothetical protein BWY15_01814 [Firmicutes bacterium ADurb.Bin193]